MFIYQIFFYELPFDSEVAEKNLKCYLINMNPIRLFYIPHSKHALETVNEATGKYALNRVFPKGLYKDIISRNKTFGKTAFAA